MFKVGDKVRVVKWDDLPAECKDGAIYRGRMEYSSFGIGKRFIDELSSASEPFTIKYAQGRRYMLNDAVGVTFKEYHLEKYAPEKCVAENDIQIGDTVVYNGNDHEKYPQLYPEKGTLGTVVAQDDAQYKVSFRKGTTSDDDSWWVEKVDCKKFDMSKVEYVKIVSRPVKCVCGWVSYMNETCGKILKVKPYGNGFIKPETFTTNYLGTERYNYVYDVNCVERVVDASEVKKPLPKLDLVANSTSRVVTDNQKIVFKQKNRTVIATKYIGDKVVARAHATCNKTDSFDFGKGMLIAYSRLIAKE